MTEYKVGNPTELVGKDYISFIGLTIQIGKYCEISENAIFVSKTGAKKDIVIGNECSVLGYAVIHHGCVLGNSVLINHHVVMLPDIMIGDNTFVGPMVVMEGYTKVGKNCAIRANSHITAFTTIEDEVFVGPGVMTINDKEVRYHREGHGKNLSGPTFKYGSRIGGGSVIMQGVTIGKNSLVGAGSVVTKDVPPKTVVVGNPAKFLRNVFDWEIIS